MSLRDLKELYRMRGLLESDAMLETVPALGAAEFTVMQEALVRMSRADAESDVRAHSLANRDFHQTLWNSLPWPRMHHQLELLYDWCSPYGALFYNEHENRELVAHEHESMFAAAREHDAVGLVELVRVHRVHVIKALEPVLYADELAIQVSDEAE
jgi:DNA-binding GntR family transcriptional regulator